MIAAASPIAGIESRGEGSTISDGEVGKLLADRARMCRPGHDVDALGGDEVDQPIPRLLEQRST